MQLLTPVPDLARFQLLAAVRLTRTADLTDRGGLESLLYNVWFAGVGPTATEHPMSTAPAWWTTWGTRGPAPSTMVRVYWNCPPMLAPTLLNGLIQIAERHRVRYTLKCPSASRLFARVEPVVLYLGIPEWTTVKPNLRALHAGLARHLRGTVPPLTLPLGRGAALAEDPCDGSSFGQSRASAVADGIIAAAALGVVSETDTVDVIAGRLTAHDIRPDRPYLRRGTPAGRITGW